MRNGIFSPGPLSLILRLGTKPAVIVNADFFVTTKKEKPPLKFSGGISVGMEESQLFIELKNQWWKDMFGLSPQIKFGPGLELSIGFQYVSKFYPTKLGIAAGLAIGSA